MGYIYLMGKIYLMGCIYFETLCIFAHKYVHPEQEKLIVLHVISSLKIIEMLFFNLARINQPSKFLIVG